jgi:hypothetical protein
MIDDLEQTARRARHDFKCAPSTATFTAWRKALAEWSDAVAAMPAEEQIRRELAKPATSRKE